MSADHTVTSADVVDVTGAVSLSSTVTVAVRVPSVTRQPYPPAIVAVTVLSSSCAVSSSVGTSNVASRDPAANVASSGTVAASAAPSSLTDTGTVSASSASPVRRSVNVASAPSSA